MKGTSLMNKMVKVTSFLTSDALGKYVFPGTRKIFLSECHNLDWRDLCHILC